VVQVGLVVRSQVLLVHLTRQVARDAAVGGASRRPLRAGGRRTRTIGHER
jgi:hypothetical protein